MKVRGLYEGEFESERDAYGYFVALFTASHAEDGYEITGASVSQAIAWAQDNVPVGGTWALGLIDRGLDGALELTWLEGSDPNVDRSQNSSRHGHIRVEI